MTLELPIGKTVRVHGEDGEYRLRRVNRETFRVKYKVGPNQTVTISYPFMVFVAMFANIGVTIA